MPNLFLPCGVVIILLQARNALRCDSFSSFKSWLKWLSSKRGLSWPPLLRPESGMWEIVASEFQCRGDNLKEVWVRPTCLSWRAPQRGRRQLGWPWGHRCWWQWFLGACPTTRTLVLASAILKSFLYPISTKGLPTHPASALDPLDHTASLARIRHCPPWASSCHLAQSLAANQARGQRHLPAYPQESMPLQ